MDHQKFYVEGGGGGLFHTEQEVILFHIPSYNDQNKPGVAQGSNTDL